MAPKALKASLRAEGTQSASALKSAAALALKGSDLTNGKSTLKDMVTVKLPPVGNGATNGANAWDATNRSPSVVKTIWDEERRPAVQSRRLAPLGESADRKLASLNGSIDFSGHVSRMDGVFDEELNARSRQRQLVGELYQDQLSRLDELSVEIDGSIADVAAYMHGFIESSRSMLVGFLDGLHGDLRHRIEGLVPRLRGLEERAAALKTGLEKEKAARIRETANILAPLQEQVEKLGADLERERKVRETRSAEIHERMTQAVAAMDAAMDAEVAGREQRVAATAQEWRHELDQLFKRQGKMERGLEELKSELLKEVELEQAHRTGAQDPVAEALTGFIQKWHAHAQEHAVLGS